MKRGLDDHYRDQQYADQDEYATRGSEMKVKTSELTGPALDWAVAKCEGFNFHLMDRTEISQWLGSYSTNWSQGGPIIEREEIDIAYCNPAAGWSATGFRNTKFGPTPLIAAMRCYVTSKLGDEVDVPEELK